MFTVRLTNHQFGYTSYYGSFTSLTDAQAATARVIRSSKLEGVSFDAVSLPIGVVPKHLHADFRGK